MTQESPDPVQFPSKCVETTHPARRNQLDATSSTHPARPAQPRPGTTSSACAERPTGPRSSYTVEAATPTAPGPSEVSATRQTHSPAGGRSTCTVSSVLRKAQVRSEEHTSELQSRRDLVCRLLLEKKKKK